MQVARDLRLRDRERIRGPAGRPGALTACEAAVARPWKTDGGDAPQGRGGADHGTGRDHHLGMDRRTGSGVGGPTVWRLALHLAGVAALLAVLWRAAPFLRLLAVAAILAAALESPVAWLVRRGWRRGVAIAVTTLAALAILAGIVGVLVPRVAPQLERAAQSAPDLVSEVRDTAAYQWLEEHAVVDRAVRQARQYVGTVLGSIVTGAFWVIGFLADIVTVVALTVFLIASGPGAWEWLVRWIPPRRRPRVRRVASGARRAVAGYVAGALVMGTIAGAVTAVTTGLLGVQYFLVLAVATALLGVIPFIGAIVSGILVVIVTWLSVGTTAALVALAVFVGYQQLEGAVLQPLVQRHTTSIQPLVVLVAVLLGMAAAGVFGAVVALPIAAAAKVVANDALARRQRTWHRERRAAPAAKHAAELPDARH